MDPNADLPCHSKISVKPVDISKFLNGQSLEFTEAAEDYKETYDADQYYEFDNVEKYTKLELLDVDESGSSLEKYKQNMVIIPYGPQQTQDGKLMKKIKEKGFGDNPTPGSTVKVHYVSYTDLQELPIDNTYLRKGFPEKFQLGTSTLILGLEYAILSMKKGEKAEFYASYELCFGEVGCPPRIPARADMLFEIQLVSFSSGVDLKTSGVGDIELDFLKNQTKEPLFQKILKQVEDLCAPAKINCKNKNYFDAAKKYREALKLLDNAQVNNLEEQEKQEEYLCKMNRNLMVCYNHSAQFKRAIVCARNACQYAHSFAEKDMKLFFLWGKALSALQDWHSAIIKFNRALNLATKKSEKAEIEKEINMAQTSRNKKNRDSERDLCQRMLSRSLGEEGGGANRQETQDNDHSYTNFAKLMEINLREFRMSDHAESDVLGPTNQYCNEEIDILTSLADKMGLVCTVGQDIVITKRN